MLTFNLADIINLVIFFINNTKVNVAQAFINYKF